MLQTNRLKLRAVELADANALFEYRSDRKINEFQGFIPTTEKEVLEFINKVNPKMNEVGTWFQFAMLLKEKNTIVGDVGIHFLEVDQQVEFGITLNKKHQGKGYATEALNCIFNYLFDVLNKHRIIASVDPRNTNSTQLLERLNMRKEAHFVKSLYMNGEWVDDVIYALLQSDHKKTESH